MSDIWEGFADSYDADARLRAGGHGLGAVYDPTGVTRPHAWRSGHM